jgi:hypothetical protein
MAGFNVNTISYIWSFLSLITLSVLLWSIVSKVQDIRYEDLQKHTQLYLRIAKLNKMKEMQAKGIEYVDSDEDAHSGENEPEVGTRANSQKIDQEEDEDQDAGGH